jgi:dihydroxyacetone kinase DhaKLM complex PTS-EIIA-like component DhaM
MLKIADAPVVEGAIIAAVQAFIGGSLDEVITAAEAARGMLKL